MWANPFFQGNTICSLLHTLHYYFHQTDVLFTYLDFAYLLSDPPIKSGSFWTFTMPLFNVLTGTLNSFKNFHYDGPNCLVEYQVIFHILWLTAQCRENIFPPIFATSCAAQNRPNKCNSYWNALPIDDTECSMCGFYATLKYTVFTKVALIWRSQSMLQNRKSLKRSACKYIEGCTIYWVCLTP